MCERQSPATAIFNFLRIIKSVKGLKVLRFNRILIFLALLVIKLTMPTQKMNNFVMFASVGD